MVLFLLLVVLYFLRRDIGVHIIVIIFLIDYRGTLNFFFSSQLDKQEKVVDGILVCVFISQWVPEA